MNYYKPCETIELDDSDLPQGWKRVLQQNLDEHGKPVGRWVRVLIRPTIEIIEDCNPEADVAKYKQKDAVQKAWNIHEGKPGYEQ